MNRTFVKPELELAVPSPAHKTIDRRTQPGTDYDTPNPVQPTMRRPEYVPAKHRLQSVAVETNTRIVVLTEAEATYQKAKAAPPSTEEADARRLVADLEAQLAAAKAKVDAIVAKGKPVDHYQDAAILAERNVRDLANEAYVALVDRILEQRYDVPRSRLPREIILAEQERFSELRPLVNYMPALSRQVDVRGAKIGEEVIGPSIEKSLSALQQLKAFLDKHLTQPAK